MHAIRGEPTAVCPGIRFLVRQDSGGGTTTTELVYVFDAESNRSFGLVLASGGRPLRGEILHGELQDTLTLEDLDGNTVWRETHAWLSADAFESEAVFDYRGMDVRVWFRTYRVPDREVRESG